MSNPLILWKSLSKEHVCHPHVDPVGTQPQRMQDGICSTEASASPMENPGIHIGCIAIQSLSKYYGNLYIYILEILLIQIVSNKFKSHIKMCIIIYCLIDIN